MNVLIRVCFVCLLYSTSHNAYVSCLPSKDNYDLDSVRKERDRAWESAHKLPSRTQNKVGSQEGSRPKKDQTGSLDVKHSTVVEKKIISKNVGKLSADKPPPPTCCPCLATNSGKKPRDTVASFLWERFLYYFWFGPEPGHHPSSSVLSKKRADAELKKTHVRGSSTKDPCCECPASMEDSPIGASTGTVSEMRALAKGVVSPPPPAYGPPPRAPPSLPSMETMLQDSLVVRMLQRSWGRLPPLGADATSERALLGSQASKFYNDPPFLRRAWQGWLDTLHRLGATNMLKDLQAWRAIKAPRKPEDLEVFSTIDSLWQDLREAGGLSAEDVMETSSLGLSSQDAQRLEAVSTACKGAVPEEEDETWCMDALPFKGRFQQKYDRCALVGNSQRLLLSESGLAIDSHELVMRVNSAHTFNIKKYTGAKTDIRILSKEAVRQYLDDYDGELPLESNVTMLALAGDYTEFFQLVHGLRARSAQTSTKRLRPEFMSRAKDLLAALKGKLETFMGVQYIGPTEPSTGFMGLALLLQVCSKVDVYGMQLGEILAVWDPHNSFRTTSSSYRYYEENGYLYNHPRINELEYSWELEHDILQVLEGAGYVRHHLAPVRNPVTEEEVLQKGVDAISEANCIRKPGQMWSPFRHMCITV